MNVNSPLVSIVIPIYKVEKYLHECINSVQSQTYENLEIILVDDGSPDGCPKICDEYAASDNRIKAIHKENGGLSDARNAGIDIASGKYIMFVDSDDVVDCTIVERLMAALLRDNSDIACCQFRYIDEDSHPGVTPHSLTDNKLIQRNDCMRALLTDANVGVYAWAKIYRRELFDKIRFPVGRLHEDVFTTYKLVDRATSISVVPDVLYFYRIRNNSITTQRFTPKHLDAVCAKNELNNFIHEHYPAEYKYSRALLAYSAALCLYKIISSDSTDCCHAVPELRKTLKENIMPMLRYGKNKISSKAMAAALSFAYPVTRQIIKVLSK